MTVISATPDTDARTLTIVSEFRATPERVWELWADPRQLERWWGPPTWPATFTELDLRPGGRASYYMTGPEGEKAGGWWEFVTVDAPRTLHFDDGFADEDGRPSTEMPVTRAEVAIEPVADGTRMTIVSRFADAEQMRQLTDMGMVEGMSEALGQIDHLLTGD
ncbi:SRPBCC domain-containing protein [Cellulomonas sp. RIT-PI-Y]|uniref:SRPBCC family protein n=1 Tax=Cellulomonas sp. RIT-PI-Y TaxID=3035297 RepID=UPI0021D93E35|nr:SRPBCC domain-containing protein [Cellulomonas sp. RIT-PI-Y]